MKTKDQIELEEMIKKIVDEESKHYSWGDYDYTVNVKGMVSELNDLFLSWHKAKTLKVITKLKQVSYDSSDEEAWIIPYQAFKDVEEGEK
jgi:hypothetical protein